MKDAMASGYNPEQDDVLRTLGLAVIAGQGVERLMSTCLTYVMHGDPYKRGAVIRQQSSIRSNAACGT